MTTNIKISTNGNYVCEVKNSGGTVIGKSGPGQMVESPSIYLPHGEEFTITERTATAEEIEAAKPKVVDDNPAGSGTEAA